MSAFSKSTLIGLAFTLAGCSSYKELVQQPDPFIDPVPIEINEIVGKDDPLADQQWAIGKLQLSETWQSLGPGSRRVTLAVIGTGIDYNHEDLRQNIHVNLAEASSLKPGQSFKPDGIDNDGNGYVDDVVGYDFVEDNGFAYDRSGAGTAAAGVIGAVHGNGKGIRGINARISLIPIRYINANGQASVPNLLKALNYAIAVKPDVIYLHLADLQFSKDIVNKEKLAIKTALESLQSLDLPVVVSAGNRGANVGRADAIGSIFSIYKNVFMVTSVDKNDKRPFVANYGMQNVHSAAPGVEVMTTLPGNRYGLQSGTYLAAAHVAGAIALAMHENYGKKSTSGFYKALLSKAGSDELSQMELETVGGNRLNVTKFLAALKD